MDSETYQQDSQYEIRAVSRTINPVITRLHFFIPGIGVREENGRLLCRTKTALRSVQELRFCFIKKQ